MKIVDIESKQSDEFCVITDELLEIVSTDFFEYPVDVRLFASVILACESAINMGMSMSKLLQILCLVYKDAKKDFDEHEMQKVKEDKK